MIAEENMHSGLVWPRREKEKNLYATQTLQMSQDYQKKHCLFVF